MAGSPEGWCISFAEIATGRVSGARNRICHPRRPNAGQRQDQERKREQDSKALVHVETDSIPGSAPFHSKPFRPPPQNGSGRRSTRSSAPPNSTTSPPIAARAARCGDPGPGGCEIDEIAHPFLRGRGSNPDAQDGAVIRIHGNGRAIRHIHQTSQVRFAKNVNVHNPCRRVPLFDGSDKVGFGERPRARLNPEKLQG